MQNYEITLQKLRLKRGFSIETYLPKKLEAINHFFTTENLDACVLGLSGGVDSAVVLALLIKASKQSNSPIKKILGLSLPISSNGSTGQDLAQFKADTLSEHFKYNFEFESVNLSYVCQMYHQNILASDFAIGQLVSIVRTPYLYFRAAVLQDLGYKSIVCGTTNRDEGGIIGFYGKASDGMNDLQILADLHKSEVYQLAEYFNIPDIIINDAPRGDVYNDKTDYELIGASYDMVEFYTLCLDYDVDYKLDVSYLPKTIFELTNLENLIKTNSHKYKVGLPSRFVDVLPRKVIGGWQ